MMARRFGMPPMATTENIVQVVSNMIADKFPDVHIRQVVIGSAVTMFYDVTVDVVCCTSDRYALTNWLLDNPNIISVDVINSDLYKFKFLLDIEYIHGMYYDQMD